MWTWPLLFHIKITIIGREVFLKNLIPFSFSYLLCLSPLHSATGTSLPPHSLIRSLQCQWARDWWSKSTPMASSCKPSRAILSSHACEVDIWCSQIHIVYHFIDTRMGGAATPGHSMPTLGEALCTLSHPSCDGAWWRSHGPARREGGA